MSSMSPWLRALLRPVVTVLSLICVLLFLTTALIGAVNGYYEFGPHMVIFGCVASLVSFIAVLTGVGARLYWGFREHLITEKNFRLNRKQFRKFQETVVTLRRMANPVFTIAVIAVLTTLVFASLCEYLPLIVSGAVVSFLLGVQFPRKIKQNYR